MIRAQLARSTRRGKKWVVTLEWDDGQTETVHFGAAGYSDYTLHGDPERKKSYIVRHSAQREDWRRSGIDSAGFWSRWLLWNKPTISESKEDITRRFGVEFA